MDDSTPSSAPTPAVDAATHTTPAAPPSPAPSPPPKPRKKAPTRGGRRPGAGRPRRPADEPTAKVAVYLPASLLAALDAHRAALSPPPSRSALVADLLANALRALSVTTQPPTL